MSTHTECKGFYLVVSHMVRLAPRFLTVGPELASERWPLWRVMARCFRAGLFKAAQVECRVCAEPLSHALAGPFFTVSCRRCKLTARFTPSTLFCCDVARRMLRVPTRCHGCRRRVCVQCLDSATCACDPMRLWCGVCAETRLEQQKSGSCRCADCAASSTAPMGATHVPESMWALEAEGMEEMSLPGAVQKRHDCARWMADLHQIAQPRGLWGCCS